MDIFCATNGRLKDKPECSEPVVDHGDLEEEEAAAAHGGGDREPKRKKPKKRSRFVYRGLVSRKDRCGPDCGLSLQLSPMYNISLSGREWWMSGNQNIHHVFVTL